ERRGRNVSKRPGSYRAKVTGMRLSCPFVGDIAGRFLRPERQRTLVPSLSQSRVSLAVGITQAPGLDRVVGPPELEGGKARAPFGGLLQEVARRLDLAGLEEQLRPADERLIRIRGLPLARAGGRGRRLELELARERARARGGYRSGLLIDRWTRHQKIDGHRR